MIGVPEIDLEQLFRGKLQVFIHDTMDSTEDRLGTWHEMV